MDIVFLIFQGVNSEPVADNLAHLTPNKKLIQAYVDLYQLLLQHIQAVITSTNNKNESKI